MPEAEHSAKPLSAAEHPENYSLIPQEALPTPSNGLPGGKHSYTIRQQSSESPIMVLVRNKGFYVKSPTGDTTGYTLDKQNGVHIAWGSHPDAAWIKAKALGRWL